jgi:hypothetical protein
VRHGLRQSGHVDSSRRKITDSCRFLCRRRHRRIAGCIGVRSGCFEMGRLRDPQFAEFFSDEMK